MSGCSLYVAICIRLFVCMWFFACSSLSVVRQCVPALLSVALSVYDYCFVCSFLPVVGYTFVYMFASRDCLFLYTGLNVGGSIHFWLRFFV